MTAKTKNKRSEKFWDLIAKRYARAPVSNREAYERKLAETRQHWHPDMEVLEFGCGTGTTAVHHAPHVKHVLGIDVSQKMLEIARSRAIEAGVENVHFEQMSIEDFDETAGRFDAVMGMSILHLLEAPEAAIAKAHLLLKPGGLFVSSTVCMSDIKGWWKAFLPPLGSIGLIPRIRFFTAEELKSKIKAAGFDIVHQYQPGKREALFLIAQKI